MTPGVTIWRCGGCGGGSFPSAALPALSRSVFETDQRREGVVEDMSVIRHMLGQENWQPRRIASVRTSDGQLMTSACMTSPGQASGRTVQDGEAPFGVRSRLAGASVVRPIALPDPVAVAAAQTGHASLALVLSECG